MALTRLPPDAIAAEPDTDSRIHAQLRQERKQAASLQQTFGLSQQETPIEDFSCALQKKILMHGRMFVTHEHVCFSSNVFGVKTILVLAFRDVVAVSKGMHGLINPSIRVATATDEYVFASFFFRDHTYAILREVWRLQRRLNGFDTDQPAPARPAPSAPSPTDKGSKSRSYKKTSPPGRSRAATVATEKPSTHEAAAPVAAASPAKAPPSPGMPATAGTAAVVTAEPLPHLVSLGGETIDCSVAEAEAVLLADGSPFLGDFKTAQGGSKVDVGEWTAVDGAGGKVREVRLVQAVKSKLSPVKETRVEETQQCSALPDGSVVVQTHQVMVDAPYGDYFVVLSKWVFAPTAAGAVGAAPDEGGCTVRVSCEVAFHKDSWFKNQIQANAIDELRGNYKVFLPLVRRRLEARGGGRGSSGSSGSSGEAAAGRTPSGSRGSGSSHRSSPGPNRDGGVSPPPLPADSPGSGWQRQELSGDAAAAAAAGGGGGGGGGGVAQLIGACSRLVLALSAPMRRFSRRTSANVRVFFLPRRLRSGAREPSRARRALHGCALWLLLPLLVAAAVALLLAPPPDDGAPATAASGATARLAHATLHAAAAARVVADATRAASVEAAGALGFVPHATMQAQLDEVRQELRQLAAAHAQLSVQVRRIEQSPAGRAEVRE